MDKIISGCCCCSILNEIYDLIIPITLFGELNVQYVSSRMEYQKQKRKLKE